MGERSEIWIQELTEPRELAVGAVTSPPFHGGLWTEGLCDPPRPCQQLPRWGGLEEAPLGSH